MGGSASPAVPASLRTATSSSPLRSTNALAKCVVPIITLSIARVSRPASASTARVAATIPPLTSAVDGRFADAITP